MYTLVSHFEEMLEQLRPPQERTAAAQEIPAMVREFLEDHEGFQTLDPHTRLAGSYAQHLTVGDIKDVDILVRVPGDPDRNEPEPKQLLRNLRSALAELPEALGTTGSADVDIAGARRSVHVRFEDRDFHLDVVPCVAPDGFDEVLYVSDKGYNAYVKSHPLGYVDLITELNQDHGEKVRPLIRLFKHFRDYQMAQRKPKSYWLGALAIREIREGGLDTDQSIGEIFRDLLGGVYNRYACLLGREGDATPNLPDPMLGHNISPNWKRTHFETFMGRLDGGRTLATEALDAESRDGAIICWQKVFGEQFPSTVEESAERMAAGAWPGSSVVAASGRVAPLQPGGAVKSRPTTFHGPEE